MAWRHEWCNTCHNMMTSTNWNIFRVTGHLCGEFTGDRRPVTRSFDAFFDLRLNKPLSKQSWGWWFETPSSPLWRHCNENRNNCGTEYVGFGVINHILLKIIYFFHVKDKPLKQHSHRADYYIITWGHWWHFTDLNDWPQKKLIVFKLTCWKIDNKSLSNKVELRYVPYEPCDKFKSIGLWPGQVGVVRQ